MSAHAMPAPRLLEMPLRFSGRRLRTPTVWLGHNLRNRVLFTRDDELARTAVLISYGDALQRPSYKQRFFTEDLRTTLGVSGPIMVDSGGFALLSKPSLSCNIKELEHVYGQVPADIVVSLDFPPSVFASNEERAGLRRKTLSNYARLKNAVSPDRLMPVVHGHSMEDLHQSCEGTAALCAHPRQIGIGGLVPLFCSGGVPSRFCYKRTTEQKATVRIGSQMLFESCARLFRAHSSTFSGWDLRSQP